MTAEEGGGGGTLKKAAIDMDGILNFRDLADASSVLAPGRVFRTGTPGKASDADASKILTDLRVARLLDLRSTDEWEPEPGPMQAKFEIRAFSREEEKDGGGDQSQNTAAAAAAAAAFDRVVGDDARAGRLVRYHSPLLDYDRYYREIAERMSTFEKFQAAVYTVQAKLVDDTNQRRLFIGKVNEGGLYLLNEVMVDSSGPEINAALSVLAASSDQSPTAFYCKAGKDRTGLVAALTLHCCGVSDKDIIADYHRSQGVGRAALGGGRIERGVKLDYTRFHGAPEEVMEHVLKYVRGKYGSIDSYLDGIGFDGEKRRRLAAALCE